MEAPLAAGIFTGQADATAAYMNGQFKIDGNLPDAIKFGALVELVFSELDIAPAGSPYAAARAVSDGPRGKGTAARGTRRVKFGVIGAGSAWGFHSAACAGSPYLQFVAVYDKNQKLAEKVAKRYKVNTMEAYSDLGEFLKSDIEAVLIMVPHVYHADIVSKVAAAKKHILCEKPMATTLEDCDRMIQAAKKAGVKLMIAENHRFLPAHQYVHDAIKKGLVGDVLLVRAYEGVNEIEGMTTPDFWKGDPIKAGGGSFMDMGAHKFATLQWVLEDEVESVTALLAKQATNLPEKAEDNALSMLRFSERRRRRGRRQLYPDDAALQQHGDPRYQGDDPGKPHVGQAGPYLFEPRRHGGKQEPVVRARDRTRPVSPLLQYLGAQRGRILRPMYPGE